MTSSPSCRRPPLEGSTEDVSEPMTNRFAGRHTSSSLTRLQVSAAFKRRMAFFASDSWQEEMMTDEELARRRWLVLPEARGKLAWDWLVIVLVLYNLVEIPLFLGFRFDRPVGLHVLNVFIDVALLVDVCLSFRTCQYMTDRTLLLDEREVAKAYLRSWFLPDLVSTVRARARAAAPRRPHTASRSDQTTSRARWRTGAATGGVAGAVRLVCARDHRGRAQSAPRAHD